MSDDDPFAEPNDTERTVIRPNPGGRRPSVASPSAPPQQQPAAAPASPDPGPAYTAPIGMGVPQNARPEPAAPRPSEVSVETGMTGMNTLNACAATLFSLVGRIRNRAQHPDPEALRRSVVAEIRAFEGRALQSRVDAQDVKVARYAICATIDDVVLNTPWGGTSVWSTQSMVGTFHRETVGGDRFYDLLARLEQEPGRNIDLLEFLYMCLSLGFEGRLRVEQGGVDKHMTIRAGLAKIIRAQRGEVEHDLSPHWPGVDKPHRPLSAWKPFWIAVAAVVAILGSSFVGLTYALATQTGRVQGELAGLDSGKVATLERRAPPVIPPPPDPKKPPTDEQAQLKRVSGFLEDEIKEKLVTVFQDANTITIRIAGSGMFPSGSDRVNADFKVPLERVAKALNDSKGPIIIAGYTDNQPIHSIRFPSNMALSLARSNSVMKMVAEHLDDPKRLSAEGRADQQPIASNDTAEGRATNRRIEIALVREQSQ